MKLKLIEDRELWDREVDRSPGSQFFHQWDCLKILEKHSGFRLLPYGFYENDMLTCLLPLYYRNYAGVRFLLSPPPKVKVTYLGPVMCDNYESLAEYDRQQRLCEMVDGINTIVKKYRPHYLSVLTPPGVTDVRPFSWSGFGVKVGYEYIIDLEPSRETLWADLSKDCRERIKSAGKESLRLEEGDDPRKMIDLLKSTLTTHSVKPVFYDNTCSYLEDLLMACHDNLKLYFLYRGEEIVGSMLNYGFKDKYVSWMGTAKNGYSEYLEWESINLGKQGGYRKYENPDANTKRLVQYKSKFNPVPEIDFDVYRRDALGRLIALSYSKLLKKSV